MVRGWVINEKKLRCQVMLKDGEGLCEGLLHTRLHLDKVHVAIDTIKDWKKCPRG